MTENMYIVYKQSSSTKQKMMRDTSLKELLSLSTIFLALFLTPSLLPPSLLLPLIICARKIMPGYSMALLSQEVVMVS